MTAVTSAQPWRALLFLYSRSWRNRVLLQLRRLKQPRYIVGALAMGAYIASLLFSPNTGAAANPVAVDATLLDIRELLALLGLTVSLGVWWLAAPSDNALAFSPAEIYFLFPAPVKRRTLVQARLFSVQAVLLINVLIWTLLLRRSAGELPGGLRAIGLWVLFTTVSLHRLAATLARTHAPDVPKRRPIARIVAVLFLAALAAAIVHAAPTALSIWTNEVARAATGFEGSRVLDRLSAGRLTMQALLTDPAVRILVWPIRAAISPAFAHDSMAFLRALPGALCVLVLHYLWILRDPQPFEELAVGASARFADRVAQMRRGSFTQRVTGRVAWSLALSGNPAVALAWKNVTAAMRTFRPKSLVIAIIMIAVIAVFSTNGDLAVRPDLGELRSAFATTFIGVFAASVLTAPAWFRLDLRHDLGHLAFIKTAPLPAHTIVATEILTAALITTVGMTLLFGLPSYLLLRSIGGPLGSAGLIGALVAGAVALGAINLLHITLYNAVALWLPAWVPLSSGGAATGGASVVGQVYITLIGILISLGILLAAPVAAGTGVWHLLIAHLPLAVVAALCLLTAVALAVLEWLGLARLLGRALDRLEPSDVPSSQT